MMTNMMFGLSFGFAALILATQHAFAGANCADRSVVLNELASKYNESRRAMGMVGNAVMMEMFASGDTGTWTLIVTTPDGTSCLVASGTGYEALAENLPPQGDPA
jgi:D-aminopeptidase